MVKLSNSLADLAERVNIALQDSSTAETLAIDKVIEAGNLLVEAKANCRHGDWLPFLQRAAVPERQAQRYMRLAKSGLELRHVSDLGGIKAALRWTEGLRLPDAGEYLFVSLDDFSITKREPLAVVCREEPGYRFLIL